VSKIADDLLATDYRLPVKPGYFESEVAEANGFDVAAFLAGPLPPAWPRTVPPSGEDC
jgi:hypothetical protein